MESIFGYIVFAVISIVISSVIRKNKKKTVPVKYTNTEKNYALSDIDKMLSKVSNEKTPDQKLAEELAFIEKSDTVGREIKEVESHRNYRNRTSYDNIKTEEKKDENPNKEDSFDLKKAIIYSSILKRKQFKY